jgi:hypothetical protein
VPDPTTATAVTVLKHEPSTTVERLDADGGTIVRKTYRVLGLRWVQSLWRPSRAQREHDHLLAIAGAGVPCLQALRWSAEKRLGGFRSSTLETRFLPAAVPLKQVLQQLPRAGRDPVRGRLARAMGELVAMLHRAGFLWCTPMPRNVLVHGDPAAAQLLVCDTPAVVATGGPLHGGRLARIDLFLAAFSPSRRTDWSASERMRWLLGYCAGDREQARQLWRRMARRRPWQNELERALAMAFLTYVAGWLRMGRPRA